MDPNLPLSDPVNWPTDNGFHISAPPNASSELQQYQQRILQLELKLQSAENEIQKLQMKVYEQQMEDKKNVKSQSRYWTDDEHQRFLEALEKYGPKDVKSIAQYVNTRNATQVRTHAQKYFLRLERENRKKEEERRGDVNSPLSCSELDQFEVFVKAIKETAGETNVDRRCELIHERFMPNTPVEDIKAWIFVHTKTIERIQMSEVQTAARSVGAKRIRSSSNPVTAAHYRSEPISHQSSFSYNSSPSMPTLASVSLNTTTAPVQSSNFNYNQYLQDSKNGKRPQSLPVSYQFAPPEFDPLFMDNSQLFSIAPSIPQSPLQHSVHHHSIQQQNLQQSMPQSIHPQSLHQQPMHQAMQMHQMQQALPSTHPTNLKPYTPGAPPPQSPAPPPPQFIQF